MIRFGVIGTNKITEEFIKAASVIEDFALTAVYSRTEERAKDFAAKFGIPHTFTNLETMANSETLDAVYIASPNSFHAQQAVMLLNHGKHVLCEKPMASNTSELQDMIHAAQTNNVVLMEALKTTLVPNFRVIQEHLPNLGKVRRYFSSYCQYSSRYDAYKEGTVLNAFNPALSNGALMDIGVYCLYPMVVLFGRPKQIKASAFMLDSGVDGEGSILLTYEDLEAVIMYSKISNSHVPCEIQGEDGTLMLDKINTPQKVEIYYRNGRREDISKPQPFPTMYYEIKEFIELIQNGKIESPTNSHRHSLIVMEIMDEVRRQIGLVFPADQRS